MNYYIEKHDIAIILEALESYILDIEHGEDNGHKYPWTIEEVEKLYDYLVNQNDVT